MKPAPPTTSAPSRDRCSRDRDLGAGERNRRDCRHDASRINASAQPESPQLVTTTRTSMCKISRCFVTIYGRYSVHHSECTYGPIRHGGVLAGDGVPGVLVQSGRPPPRCPRMPASELVDLRVPLAELCC